MLEMVNIQLFGNKSSQTPLTERPTYRYLGISQNQYRRCQVQDTSHQLQRTIHSLAIADHQLAEQRWMQEVQ